MSEVDSEVVEQAQKQEIDSSIVVLWELQLKNDEYAIRELFYSMKAISEKKEVPYNNPSIGCSIKWK